MPLVLGAIYGRREPFISTMAAKERDVMESRELYRSPNGDCWRLVREPVSGRVFVRHEANLPSGGRVSELAIGEFLAPGRAGPEHQALLRLIGTLVDEPAG